MTVSTAILLLLLLLLVVVVVVGVAVAGRSRVNHRRPRADAICVGLEQLLRRRLPVPRRASCAGRAKHRDVKGGDSTTAAVVPIAGVTVAAVAGAAAVAATATSKSTRSSICTSQAAVLHESINEGRHVLFVGAVEHEHAQGLATAAAAGGGAVDNATGAGGAVMMAATITGRTDTLQKCIIVYSTSSLWNRRFGEEPLEAFGSRDGRVRTVQMPTHAPFSGTTAAAAVVSNRKFRFWSSCWLS